MRSGAAVAAVLALALGVLSSLSVTAAAEEEGRSRRRSLHQPFIPIGWSPPPPVSEDIAVTPPPPPPPAVATGGGRSASSLTSTIGIALTAGLVALAVVSYSCILLCRRVSDGGDDDRATAKPLAAVAARVPSDVGSSYRHHRSPLPSSTASGAIYLDPLTATMEVDQQQSSPNLRPLPMLKQPSPDLRPLPPLKWPGSQPRPPPSAQANSVRPSRHPPPPPLPRQRLLRPLPSELPPPAALANLALTNPPGSSVQDRGADNSDVLGGTTRPPSLKPLHWDRLRAISGRTIVWNQIQNSGSFRVDEAAKESLFPKNGVAGSSGHAPARVGGSGKRESRLLDPKRLQNVTIMIKALNVTVNQVIEALVHGNLEDKPEFYETLAKMAPTKEEEVKLKDYIGDLSKIDPAERFLKDVLDVVPFAFKRVDAMLYRTNFDIEVNYLRKSFGTLEAACADLRSSNLFMKLLDAVLKTGNRTKDRTNRGDARAFKLDTLPKLADIKTADGKTTLLHLVIQEVIRSQGFDSGQTATSPGSASEERFSRRDGLRVLAGLSSELSSVRRAATLDMDTLSGTVLRLETDLTKVKLVLRLRETCSDQRASAKFFEAMDTFLGSAQMELGSMKMAEMNAWHRVKETTRYFHGDATVIEEPHHPLRVFMVVSEFLLTLDRVCRDVDRSSERAMMGSGRSVSVTAGTSLQPRRHEQRREQRSSSDEEDSSSS